jgi:hypothetical protein
MHFARAAALLLCSFSVAHVARAQPPATGPLVLRLPATPRTTALGNAWVAGRDQEVIFYNPAQLIGARAGFDVSFMRSGADGRGVTVGSVYAAGRMSLTLGWGLQIASFSAGQGVTYPFSPDVLVGNGEAKGQSSLLSIGGAIVYKGFRVGAAGKYAADRVSIPAGIVGAIPAHDGVLLADIGVARNLFGGVAAFSAQNLGRPRLDRLPIDDDDEEEEDDDDGEDDDDDGDDLPRTIPRQLLMGWSITKIAGPLDLALFTQVLVRQGWTSPSVGLDVGYSWIEGCVVSLRAGARRPESEAERPYSLGGAVTIDRISLEYAVQFFDDRRFGHGVTLRWR